MSATPGAALGNFMTADIEGSWSCWYGGAAAQGRAEAHRAGSTTASASASKAAPTWRAATSTVRSMELDPRKNEEPLDGDERFAEASDGDDLSVIAEEPKRPR